MNLAISLNEAYTVSPRGIHEQGTLNLPPYYHIVRSINCTYRLQQPLQVTIDVERTVQHDTVIELGSMPVSEVDLGNPRDSESHTLTDVKPGQ